MPAASAGEVLFSPVLPGEIEAFRGVELLRGPHGSGCYDYGQGSCFAYDPPSDIPQHTSMREERRNEK
jgi:hypothetical protein